jgi:hypothetical protein
LPPSFEVIVVSWAEPDQMRGMTAFAQSFQARTLSLEGRPRAGAFARVGKTVKKGFGRQRASRRLAASASWEIGAPRGRRPIREFGFEKARGRFPGAGSIAILAMMKICR